MTTIQNDKNTWGYHLIMDIGECNVEKISNKENITKCIHHLIKKTKMHALGDPVFKTVLATPQMLKKHIDGISVVQFIETSSITMHFVNSERAGFIDFFSCKEFKPEDVQEILVRHFDPHKIKIRYITRDILV